MKDVKTKEEKWLAEYENVKGKWVLFDKGTLCRVVGYYSPNSKNYENILLYGHNDSTIGYMNGFQVGVPFSYDGRTTIDYRVTSIVQYIDTYASYGTTPSIKEEQPPVGLIDLGDSEIEVVDNVSITYDTLVDNKYRRRYFHIDKSHEIGYDSSRDSYKLGTFTKEYPNLKLDRIMQALELQLDIKKFKYLKNTTTVDMLELLSASESDYHMKHGGDYDREYYDTVFDKEEENVMVEEVVEIKSKTKTSNKAVGHDGRSLVVQDTNTDVVKVANELDSLSPEVRRYLESQGVKLPSKVKEDVKKAKTHMVNSVSTRNKILSLIKSNKIKLKSPDDTHYCLNNELTVHYVIDLDNIEIKVEVRSVKRVSSDEEDGSNYGTLTHMMEIKAVEKETKDSIILLRIVYYDKPYSYREWIYSDNANHLNKILGVNAGSKLTSCLNGDYNTRMREYVVQVYRGEVLSFMDNFVGDMMEIRRLADEGFPIRERKHLSMMNWLIVNNKKGLKFDSLLNGSKVKKEKPEPNKTNTSNNLEGSTNSKDDNANVKIECDPVIMLRDKSDISVADSESVFGFKEFDEITSREIKLRFNKLAKLYHPDVGGNELDIKSLIECKRILLSSIK